MAAARKTRTRLDIVGQRLRNEYLVGAPLGSPAEVVAWLCAVQAQDYAGAKWAVAQRTPAHTDADVEEAFDAGRILRTHVLRPTWHFVRPEDIRWMLALTAPRIRAAMAYYDRKLEIDGKVRARSQAVLAKALKGGRHRTRTELAAALEGAGIAAKGQRLGHLLMHAELDAVVCSGARRGKQQTYALVDERVAAQKGRSRDEAVAELTRRYFTSHGPAQVQDFVWWSGLTVKDARQGIEAAGGGLASDDVDGKTFWYAPGRTVGRRKAGRIHLLPNYDEYLIAFRDHSPSFDPAVGKTLGRPENVFANHIVVRDGMVIGGWRRIPDGKGVRIEARLLVRLDAEGKEALRVEAERLSRFLGAPVAVRTTMAG